MKVIFKNIDERSGFEKPVNRRKISSFNSSQSNIVQRMTSGLENLFYRCNPDTRLSTRKVKSRCLTVPCEPVIPGTNINVEGNLILSVNDIITDKASSRTYEILDLLGKGAFGQVFKCLEKSAETPSNESKVVALKVKGIKSRYSRRHNKDQIKDAEVDILSSLSKSKSHEHIVHLLSDFHFSGHPCLVFECLGSNLFDVLKENSFQGLPMHVIRHILTQTLIGLNTLEAAGIIHADLKPENVLIKTLESEGGGGGGGGGGIPDVQIIDFGSACRERESLVSYTQSRFYRAPEVLLNLPYDVSIDMWSFGCLSAELFLGLPLFPGVSQHNQLSRIVEIIGDIPDELAQASPYLDELFTNLPESTEGNLQHTTHGAPSTMPRISDCVDELQHTTHGAPMKNMGNQYFMDKNGDGATKNSSINRGIKSMGTSSAEDSGGMLGSHRLLSADEYAQKTGSQVPSGRKYLRYDNLHDIIMKSPMTYSRGPSQQENELRLRTQFVDLVSRCLALRPWERIMPLEALAHPFIRGDAPCPVLNKAGLLRIETRRDRIKWDVYRYFQRTRREHAANANALQQEQRKHGKLPIPPQEIETSDFGLAMLRPERTVENVPITHEHDEN